MNAVNVFDPIWICVDYQERRRHSCKRHETTTDGVNNKDYFFGLVLHRHHFKAC